MSTVTLTSRPPLPSPSSAQLASVSRRLADVRQYQLPRLRACRSVTLQRDLAAESRADLEHVRATLEDVREAVDALPRTGLGAGVYLDEDARCSALQQEYQLARAEYRSAIVEAKRASQAAALRYELLDTDGDGDGDGSGSGSGSGHVKGAGVGVGVSVGGEDALQTKTNEVTDALRRTTQLLQVELERSVLSVQMLDSSTKTIHSTHGLYDRYTSLLDASGVLVRSLERADWWDRALILAALSLFLAVVAFVVKQRVLDKAVHGVAWWVGGSLSLVRKGIGAAGGAAGMAGAAAAAGTATKPSIPNVPDGPNVIHRASLLDTILDDPIPPSSAIAAGSERLDKLESGADPQRDEL